MPVELIYTPAILWFPARTCISLPLIADLPHHTNTQSIVANVGSIIFETQQALLLGRKIQL